MKNKNVIIILILPFFILTVLLSSCHERWEGEDFYTEYNRVVGPDGGNLIFYKNYQNDSLKNKLATLTFEENTLDSIILLNYYEFYNERLRWDLFDNFNIEQITPFFYFVPFYKSEGYNEHGNNDEEYHLSIPFKKNVKVSYSLEGYDYSSEYKLYRIIIPRTNEWGEDDNIWVAWNNQGYPNGYEQIDLIYLLNGQWTQSGGWGGNLEMNLTNWEEIGYKYDNENNTINFEVQDTDWIYALVEIYIK